MKKKGKESMQVQFRNKKARSFFDLTGVYVYIYIIFLSIFAFQIYN